MKGKHSTESDASRLSYRRGLIRAGGLGCGETQVEGEGGESKKNGEEHSQEVTNEEENNRGGGGESRR